MTSLTNSGLGHLLIRGIVGAVLAFYGSQKLFAWFGGGGIEAVAKKFETMDIPYPLISVYLAGSAEFFGGLALLLGLLTRPVAAILAFTMFVAFNAAHAEFALTLAVVCTGLIFLGPGRLSLDHLICNCCGCCKKSTPDCCKTDA